jgi:HK97 gp10 family phage protein
MFKLTATAAMNRNLDLLIRSVIVPPLAEATQKACSFVLQDARAIVPVDTGELKGSGRQDVTEERGAVTGTVSFTAEHAGFVEYGTGLRGRGTYPGPLPQTGVPITGSWVYDYKSQGWIGMKAQPYLRPALDQNRQRIIALFRR